MKKVALISALAFGVAAPAVAQNLPADNAAFLNQLSVQANGDHVREMLSAKNYRNVSVLHLDENGRWTGTAEKNGSTRLVSVYLPQNYEGPLSN